MTQESNDHLKQQLQHYRANMRHFHEQAAVYGGFKLAPLEIANQAKEQAKHIRELKADMHRLNIPVQDLPEDELFQQGAQVAPTENTGFGVRRGEISGAVFSYRVQEQQQIQTQIPWLRLVFMLCVLGVIGQIAVGFLQAWPALLTLIIQFGAILFLISMALGPLRNALWQLVGWLFNACIGAIGGVFTMLAQFGGQPGQSTILNTRTVSFSLRRERHQDISVQFVTSEAMPFLPNGTTVAIGNVTQNGGVYVAGTLRTSNALFHTRQAGAPVFTYVLAGLLGLVALGIWWGPLVFIRQSVAPDSVVSSSVTPQLPATSAPPDGTPAPGASAIALTAIPKPAPTVVSSMATETTRFARVVGVSNSTLRLRRGSPTGTIIIGIAAGSRVELLGETRDLNGTVWQRVRFAGKEGWVSNDYLEIES